MAELTDLQGLYRKMLLIRRFEEKVLAEFSRGVFYGTTHTYLGQEANAVAVLSQSGVSDIVVSNHRCHGHFLAYGGSPHSLFAELMGKETGVCGGRGGSQHIHWKNFYSSGVLGGTVALAVGMAVAEKQKASRVTTTVFMGDGALGEGIVYEALNLAGLWRVPLLIVLENNHIAQTTPTSKALAGEIGARFKAFGIPFSQMDTSDVEQIIPAAGQAAGYVRSGRGPYALILNTERFGPHSKGDDTRPTQTLEEIQRERDPLMILARRMKKADIERMTSEITKVIDEAFEKALTDPAPREVA
jgi:TPP-dependent pyruvate/acetoin dehydrogenase alpha subunit